MKLKDPEKQERQKMKRPYTSIKTHSQRIWHPSSKLLLQGLSHNNLYYPVDLPYPEPQGAREVETTIPNIDYWEKYLYDKNFHHQELKKIRNLSRIMNNPIQSFQNHIKTYHYSVWKLYQSWTENRYQSIESGSQINYRSRFEDHHFYRHIPRKKEIDFSSRDILLLFFDLQDLEKKGIRPGSIRFYKKLTNKESILKDL